MVKSMTGFGRGEAVGQAGRVVVEMKAVNHRFAEVVFRMPKQFNALEDPARKLVQSRVSRGRIDLFVSWEAAAQARGVKVDKELAMAYYKALTELAREIGSNTELTLDTLAKLPDVLTVADGEMTATELWPVFESAVAQALDNLMAMREREGSSLAGDLTARLFTVEAFADTVRSRAPHVVDEYRSRLAKRLEDLLPQGNTLDPQRLAQEVAIFADRSDISEEVERLASHLQQFRQSLTDTEAVGRKLDFLVQEIGREINTVGSKANDALITARVVEAKGELEKIREQIQNLE